MLLTLPIPVNVVLAFLTAFSELIILPFAKWGWERVEGTQLHSEIMQGHVIEAKRRELGPFRLPLGRQTPNKVCSALMLSGGVLIAVTLSEYGFQPTVSQRDFTRNVDTMFISTQDNNYKQGLLHSTPPKFMVDLMPCVEIGKLKCIRRYGDQTCVRSVYNEALMKDGKLICADKSTGMLRNTSDIDVIFYDNLRAKIDSIGEELTVEPPLGFISANKINMSMEEEIMEGFQVTRLGFSGVNVFWNDSAVFLTLYGSWLRNEDGYPVELGFFPNPRQDPRDYCDAAATITLQSILRIRMDAIAGALVQVHLASAVRKMGFI